MKACDKSRVLTQFINYHHVEGFEDSGNGGKEISSAETMIAMVQVQGSQWCLAWAEERMQKRR